MVEGRAGDVEGKVDGGTARGAKGYIGQPGSFTKNECRINTLLQGALASSWHCVGVRSTLGACRHASLRCRPTLERHLTADCMLDRRLTVGWIKWDSCCNQGQTHLFLEGMMVQDIRRRILA
jgi:hypothetical protein